MSKVHEICIHRAVAPGSGILADSPGTISASCLHWHIRALLQEDWSQGFFFCHQVKRCTGLN